MLHTHGTALMEMLPLISQLKGLGVMQIGRDMKGSEPELGMEHLLNIRKITGDTPLRINVNVQEFLEGVKNKTLPGGAEYFCNVKDINEANKLANIAKEYKVPFC